VPRASANVFANMGCYSSGMPSIMMMMMIIIIIIIMIIIMIKMGLYV
jgi:hypothetical protein